MLKSTTNTTETPVREFHYMVCAQVVFSIPGKVAGTYEINAVNINAVVKNDRDQFTIDLLAKAQNLVQMQLNRKMEGTALTVQDVVIMNLMNLGYMTEAEFNAAPPGMERKEVAKTVLGKTSLQIVKTAANQPFDPAELVKSDPLQ